jgi:DNA-binding CsgD family transcriptional regulator
VLAEAELGLGRTDAAEAAAKRAEALGTALGLEMYIAAGRLARALVLLARGATTAAASAASDAAELCLQADWPVEAARAQLVLGRALASSGRRAGAVREFEAAYATCVASGARRIGDQAAQELRRLGRRPPRRFAGRDGADHGLAALTPREREVAALVARGHTNREIGEALFVSTRTVETHVSRVFEKLDVSSRAALAAAVERRRDAARAD